MAIRAQWAVNFTSPRRFGGRAGLVWCVYKYVTVVSIFSVLGYVKGTKRPQLEGIDW